MSRQRDAAEQRAAELRRRLRRHRLVFMQSGAAFQPLEDDILCALGGDVYSVDDIGGPVDTSKATGPVVVLGLEDLAEPPGSGTSLGTVREWVSSCLDVGRDVCLVSRLPRVAYPRVPGSSVLDDASFFHPRLLEAPECEPELKDCPGSVLPAVGLRAEAQLTDVFSDALSELGLEVLAALDHLLFEAYPASRRAFEHLQSRELEAVRGAGLVTLLEDGTPVPTAQERWSELLMCLADALAMALLPQAALTAVVEDLWFIERSLRARVRKEAQGKYGLSWRTRVLKGDMPNKVLDRARGDAYVGARSLKEVRDPLEWLSLGELLDIAKGPDYGALGVPSVVWRKFSQDVLPIRNRMSHMRLLRRGDAGVVSMWRTQITKILR